MIVAVENLEILGQPGILPMRLEQPMRQPVEGTHPHAAGIHRLAGIGQQRFQAGAHFPRGLVGKGDRHDGVGRYLLDLNQPGDPMHQHPGLAAARTGQNQLVMGGGGNGLALGVVQIVKQGGYIHGQVAGW